MGLIKFLKEKIFKKKEDVEKNEKYVKGMEKSRHNFASKLDTLSKSYKTVNKNTAIITIKSDFGENFITFKYL